MGFKLNPFTGKFDWDSEGGGSGSVPGGSDGQPQYNNGGAFGGMQYWVWDNVFNRLKRYGANDDEQYITIAEESSSFGDHFAFQFIAYNDNASAHGYDLYFQAANGTDGNEGGNVYFKPGGGNGLAGKPIFIFPSNDDWQASLNGDALTASREFAFPDTPGTFVVVEEGLVKAANDDQFYMNLDITGLTANRTYILPNDKEGTFGVLDSTDMANEGGIVYSNGNLDTSPNMNWNGNTFRIGLDTGPVTGDDGFTPGTGYAISDNITVNGGTSGCVLTVDSVGGAGEVLTYHIAAHGEGYTEGNKTTITGGAGTGFEIFVTIQPTGSFIPDFGQVNSGPTFHKEITLLFADGGVYEQLTIGMEALTDGRQINFPDANGIIALTSDLTGFIDGSGAATRVAYYTDANTITSDAAFTFNSGTGALSAVTFIGNLTGNVTGNVSGNAGTVTVADAGGDTTTFVMLATDATGSLSPRTDAGLTYNATTNALSATTFIGALTGNASTATALATPRNIGGVPFDGTADIVPQTIVVQDTTDTTCFVVLFEDATGNLAPKTDAGITYNASTGVLTATGFSGPLTGNVTGNVSGNAGTVTVADAGGDTTMFVMLATDATGSLQPRTDAGLSYNANTNALTATTFIGALQGNADTATSATSATTATTATTATNATNITLADESSDATCFVIFATGATGNLPPKTNAGLIFNSSTGQLQSTLVSAATAFIPDTNGGASLGVATTGEFSNIFLVEGAAINWDNGDATLTQTGNLLVLAGANFQTPFLGVGMANTGSAYIEMKTLTVGSIQGLRIEADTASNIQFSSFVTGDGFVRFTFLGNGRMEWGPGSGVADTSLERSGVGAMTLAGDLSVNDEAYGAGWNGSLEVPTKNAIYDKIQTLAGGDIAMSNLAPSGDVTITAGYSGYVVDYYEIASTFALEIGDGAVFEVG